MYVSQSLYIHNLSSIYRFYPGIVLYDPLTYNLCPQIITLKELMTKNLNVMISTFKSERKYFRSGPKNQVI